MHKTYLLAFAATFGLAGTALAGSESKGQDAKTQEQPRVESTKDQKKQRPPTKANKKAVAGAVTPVATEALALKNKADEVTKKIGELASSGKLTTSQEAVDQLKQLVEELGKVNEQLKKMNEDIEEIKGWIEGQNESMPVLQGDVDNLKKTSWGNYVQFQFSDTQNSDRNPIQNDGFNMRRVRLSTTNRIDPKTSMKISFDLATGNRRTTAELKDAQLTYTVQPDDEKVGTHLLLGQQPLPLGYELERSSSAREFPERTQYNQRLFAGERGRGVYVKHGLSNDLYAHAGVWNSLTYNDPQQVELDAFRNPSGTELAYHAGLKYHKNNFEAGVSGFVGERPSLTYTPTGGAAIKTDSGTRRFFYLDAAYVGFLVPQLTLRGEAVFGSERMPQFSGSGSSRRTAQSFSTIRGHHLQASYKIDWRNILSARYEFFDPNTGKDDNLFGWGLAYTYFLNPGARLTLGHEIFTEQGTQNPNNITTLRLQIRL